MILSEVLRWRLLSHHIRRENYDSPSLGINLWIYDLKRHNYGVVWSQDHSITKCFKQQEIDRSLVKYNLISYFIWYYANAALSWGTAQKWRRNIQISDELRIFKRCRICVAGTVFDLWKFSQIWSPVPCEKSICDTPTKELRKEVWKSSAGRRRLQVVAVFAVFIIIIVVV